MIPALEDFLDRVLGRGDAAITVPPFDGPLKPNQLLESAEVLGEFAEPEDLAEIGGALYLADGLTLRRLEGSSSREVRRFDRPITAICGLPGGRLAVALDGTEIRMFAAAEGNDEGKRIAGGLHAVNALAAGGDGSLLATDGSANEPYGEWVRDLLNRGRSGRLLSVDTESGAIKVRASGLQFAFGAASVGNDVLVSESWKHRLLAVAPNGSIRIALDQLPVYPSRIVPASDGGFWLTAFTRKDPVDRVHPARKRLSQADDAGGAAGVLGRAEAAVGRLVPRADAGRTFEDHGRGQAMGAAAFLWARDPARIRFLAAVFLP